VLGISLEAAVEKMRGAPNTKITVTIRREGAEKPIQISMTREAIKIQVVKSRLEGDIAYIRLSSFMSEQADKNIRDAFLKLRDQAGGKLRGVVLDLRSNPGGLLDQAVAVSNDFMRQGEIVSIRGRRPDESQRWQAKNGDITDGLPLVVLIDGGSASASEIVAGALQDHRRAIVVGQRSFGKGSVQTVIPLGTNGAMALTTARYYTPSGRSIQGLGIMPDIEVALTREEKPRFGPSRESDLNGIIANKGGAPTDSITPRTDLPAIAKDIPKVPPENAPAFDPAKPETDFQLQQGLVVVRAMQVSAVR
jgi:carboxyl-terminal processing protease